MTKDIYKGSRIGYIIAELTNYFITILISGAYLAKLTQELGFSDSLTAILSAFTAIGCSFQMLSLAFFRRGRAKRKVSIFYMLNELLFLLLYIVPFFSASKTAKIALFVGFMVTGYILLNIASPARTNWFMSLIDDDKRGRFTAMKEAISLAGGIAFQFVMSGFIDHFEASGNVKTAFIICGGTIFLLMVAHTLSMVLSKEKEPVEKPKQSIKKDFIDVLADKNIRSVIGLSSFWGICSHIAIPFYGTYIIKELGFSMTFVAVLSVVYAAARISSSIVLGKYADKTSFAKMLKICYAMVSCGFLVASFMTPSNGYITYTVYYILYAAAMGGINSAEINLIYDCVVPEKRANALAVKQTLYGLFCFGATLVVSPLLSYIQNSGNKFLGINIYAQQVLSIISFIATILLIIYLNRHIKNMEKRGE